MKKINVGYMIELSVPFMILIMYHFSLFLL